MGHCVGDVPGAGLTLGADHGRALSDAPQRLTQVGGSADERNGEGLLVDVVGVVGRGEDLGLIDVVHAEALEHLGLHEVADAGLGHDRDGDGLDDAGDEVGVAHAGNAALGSNVGGDSLEGHDGDGSRVLGDAGLLGRDDVHDDTALEHVRHAALNGEGSGAGGGLLCAQSWSSGREPWPPHRCGGDGSVEKMLIPRMLPRASRTAPRAHAVRPEPSQDIRWLLRSSSTRFRERLGAPS